MKVLSDYLMIFVASEESLGIYRHDKSKNKKKALCQIDYVKSAQSAISDCVLCSNQHFRTLQFLGKSNLLQVNKSFDHAL